MKKSIILAMMGVVLMLGLVGCPQEEAWSDGAPSEIAGKVWFGGSGILSGSYYKWASDGSYKMSSTGTTWNDYTTLKIDQYRSNEIKVGETTYNYGITDGHMKWTGSGVTWFEWDETTDPSAQ